MSHPNSSEDTSEVGNVEGKCFFVVDINSVEVKGDDLVVIFEVCLRVVLETLSEEGNGWSEE